MNRFLLTLALSALALSASAEIPASYYAPLNGKKEAELKTATFQVIHNLTRISSYSDLPKYFQETDVYPEKENGKWRWWDMYSDIPLYAPSFNGLNREHSFPKSWWGGSQNVNAYTDLNHLYPSEMKANTAKSNYPLGTVDMRYTPNFDNGVVKVGYAVAGQGGGAKYVFEPNDEYKGDFARTYFYMVTCYQDYTWKPEYMWMLQQNTYPTLNDWSIDLLLKWSREDPVSQKEVDRNEVVWKKQNNRNPFIDFPMLAEYIWGNRKGEAFDLASAGGGTGEVPGDPELLAPVQDMTLDFGQVAIGKSVTAPLHFKGHDIKGELSIRLYSGDKEMFSLPSSAITASLVNAEDGYMLNITYTPTEVGEHQTRLLISDGGLEGSRGVGLMGECLEVPVLSPCVAYEATDITADSYTASWSTPDRVVDYFVVTRTRYVGGEAFTEEVLAEGTEVVMEDFDQSDSEAYYVQSARLGFLSDPSNVIFVMRSGITGVAQGEPLAAIGLQGAARIICSAPHTGCTVYDTTGRVVAVVSVVDNNTDLPLPLGVYLITTDQCQRPVRVLVK